MTLDVDGDEHLYSARPAVFLFNHQSQLDVIVLAKLLRGGFTGVAKKEAAAIPGFGAAFRLADVAFVDRSDTGAAKAALAPAAQRLREGVSLVIAPEGTRSATPALGPFKKGAFHVAMQAGVPLVPIVIHNAGELMWRGATTVREGTVRVTVLPPVATDGWTAAVLDARVAGCAASRRSACRSPPCAPAPRPRAGRCRTACSPPYVLPWRSTATSSATDRAMPAPWRWGSPSGWARGTARADGSRVRSSRCPWRGSRATVPGATGPGGTGRRASGPCASWCSRPAPSARARPMCRSRRFPEAGTRITGLYPLGPLAGCAATVTLVAHDDTACVGIVLDAAAVTRPELFVERLRAGLAAVTGLAGPD